MPYYRVGGLMVHLSLSGKARKNPPKACPFFVTVNGRKERCLQMAPYLCDWPGCDVPICGDHALHLSLDPDLDVCPHHNHQRGLLSRLLTYEPCDHDWDFHDASFDHEYGTERVHYFVCEKCGAERPAEAGDYDWEDSYL